LKIGKTCLDFLEKNLKRGIRSSLENYGRDGNIEVIPLYTISTLIREY